MFKNPLSVRGEACVSLNKQTEMYGRMHTQDFNMGWLRGCSGEGAWAGGTFFLYTSSYFSTTLKLIVK